MTPTETRKFSGSTARDREDQYQLLAQLRQNSMTSKLMEKQKKITLKNVQSINKCGQILNVYHVCHVKCPLCAQCYDSLWKLISLCDNKAIYHSQQ